MQCGGEGGRRTRAVFLLAALIAASTLAAPGQRLLPGQARPPAAAKSPAPRLPSPPPAPPPPPDPLVAEHDLRVGRFYYNRGNYVGALARFEDAIYNQPSAAAFCRAGDAEFKLKHALPALVDWRRCARAAAASPQGKWARHARKELKRHPLPSRSPS